MAAKKKEVLIEKEKKKADNSGLFIPAGLFIGMGIGFLIDQLVAGTFLGLGAGFLLMAFARHKQK